MRRTNGLVLIIPDCDNPFYQNMVYGGAYYSFMTEELPLLLRTIFRLSPPRSQNYIAGLSMGGYGALYLGLSRRTSGRAAPVFPARWTLP